MSYAACCCSTEVSPSVLTSIIVCWVCAQLLQYQAARWGSIPASYYLVWAMHHIIHTIYIRKQAFSAIAHAVKHHGGVLELGSV